MNRDYTGTIYALSPEDATALEGIQELYYELHDGPINLDLLKRKQERLRRDLPALEAAVEEAIGAQETPSQNPQSFPPSV